MIVSEWHTVRLFQLQLKPLVRLPAVTRIEICAFKHKLRSMHNMHTHKKDVYNHIQITGVENKGTGGCSPTKLRSQRAGLPENLCQVMCVHVLCNTFPNSLCHISHFRNS